MKNLRGIVLICVAGSGLWPVAAIGSPEETTHTGKGTSQKVACEAAKSLASEEGALAGTCDCRQSGSVHICTSNSSTSNATEVVRFTPVKPVQKEVTRTTQRSAECPRLVRERDTTLAATIDQAIKGYSAARDSLEVLLPVKREVERAKLLNATVDAAHRITLALKTAANAIGDLLGFVPATGAVANAARIISASERNLAFLTDDVDGWLRAEALNLTPGIGPGLKAAYNLADNINSLKNAQSDAKELLEANSRQIEQLEKLIRQHIALMNSSDVKIKLINTAKNQIDAMCR